MRETLVLLFLFCMVPIAAFAEAPPHYSFEAKNKPSGLDTSGGGFETPNPRISPPIVGNPCESFPGGGKKCTLPSFPMVGPDWTTTVGLGPLNHFIFVKEESPNTIQIELNFDYGSPIEDAFDPGVSFAYRLINPQNAILAVVDFTEPTAK